MSRKRKSLGNRYAATASKISVTTPQPLAIPLATFLYFVDADCPVRRRPELDVEGVAVRRLPVQVCASAHQIAGHP